MDKRKRSGIFYQVQNVKPTGISKMSKADIEICTILDEAWKETEIELKKHIKLQQIIISN